MGFEPGQPCSRLESVNKFKEQMADVLTEAKAALLKSKDEMAKYYDQRRTPTPDYQPRDRVYLDTSDIHMTVMISPLHVLSTCFPCYFLIT